jgi:hypothetical protein
MSLFSNKFLIKYKKFSHIVDEWHPTKNGELNPSNVSYGSKKLIWWQCKKHHEWQSKVNSRTSRNSKKSGCPYCFNRYVLPENSIVKTNPEVLKLWHYEKNNIKPEEISSGSNKKVWWKCLKGHEYEQCLNHKINSKVGCPYCSNKKVCNDNCLQTTHLLKFWHQSKNKLLPSQITAYSGKKAWWQCPLFKDHEWEAIICNVSNGHFCPCCTGKKVVKSNSFKYNYPDLLCEWDFLKNTLDPEKITSRNPAKAWWLCDKGHSWEACIGSRANGTGCPICKESKGEKLITKYLSENNIKYERQFTFETCRYKNKLPFDFGVFVRNVLYLIEFQGRQHYEEGVFGSKIDDAKTILRTVKKRDKIKYNFCKKNNIPLIVIPYWEKDDISNLLNDFLFNKVAS